MPCFVVGSWEGERRRGEEVAAHELVLMGGMLSNTDCIPPWGEREEGRGGGGLDEKNCASHSPVPRKPTLISGIAQQTAASRAVFLEAVQTRGLAGCLLSGDRAVKTHKGMECLDKVARLPQVA